MDLRSLGADAQPRRPQAAEVTELWQLSASSLREKIAARDVSPVELTETILARAEKLQPVLNCFITLAGEQATHDAERLLPEGGRAEHGRPAEATGQLGVGHPTEPLDPVDPEAPQRRGLGPVPHDPEHRVAVELVPCVEEHAEALARFVATHEQHRGTIRRRRPTSPNLPLRG